MSMLPKWEGVHVVRPRPRVPDQMLHVAQPMLGPPAIEYRDVRFARVQRLDDATGDETRTADDENLHGSYEIIHRRPVHPQPIHRTFDWQRPAASGRFARWFNRGKWLLPGVT